MIKTIMSKSRGAVYLARRSGHGVRNSSLYGQARADNRQHLPIYSFSLLYSLLGVRKFDTEESRGIASRRRRGRKSEEGERVERRGKRRSERERSRNRNREEKMGKGKGNREKGKRKRNTQNTLMQSNYATGQPNLHTVASRACSQTTSVCIFMRYNFLRLFIKVIAGTVCVYPLIRVPRVSEVKFRTDHLRERRQSTIDPASGESFVGPHGCRWKR